MLGSLGEISYSITSKDETAEGLNSAGDRAKKVGKIAGAAMTGIGVGMIVLTDSAKKTNATIRQTALQLGVTTKEMRELTLATTNVTFPIEEVTGSFDLLTRAGMTNKEEIAAVATAYDTLGDAIGKTATEVTGPMVTAMKTFGLEMSEGAKYTDKMTYLLRNTTLEMDNFKSIIAKIPPDIVKMGLTMDDTIALLGLMEEAGLSGAIATLEFQKAVTGARKTGEPLNEVLGFTSKQLEEYKEKLEGATGMTEEYAAAANTQFGTMDKLKQSISELTLKYGSMLEPIEALGPAMSVMGPIMIMASSMNWSMFASLTAHAAAAWAAIAPYLMIIAPIVAVIAILYVLQKKFGFVTKFISFVTEGLGKLGAIFGDLGGIFDRFGGSLGRLGAGIKGLLPVCFGEKEGKPAGEGGACGDYITKGLGTLATFLKEKFFSVIQRMSDLIVSFGDKILFLLGPIGAIIFAIKHWEEIWTYIKELFTKILTFFATLPSKFRAAGEAMVQALIDGIKSRIGKPAELIEGALRAIRVLLPGSDAKEGPLSDLTHSGKALLETFAAGMESADTSMGKTFEEAMPIVSATKGIGGESGISRGGDTFNLGPVTISNDYDVERMWAKIQELQQAKRVQRGINAV